MRLTLTPNQRDIHDNIQSPAHNTSDHVHHGTKEFRHTMLALFLAGFATFSTIYCVQPLMPLFSREYAVSSTNSTLSLSLTTGVMAFMLLLVGNVSDRWGRKKTIVAALLISACLVMATGFAPNWNTFLFERALLGISISGVPAVAMTYLNEELHRDSLGVGMGLYISGNAVGGLSGRMIASIVSNYYGWHNAMFSIGLISMLFSVLIIYRLPRSRHFSPQPLSRKLRMANMRVLMQDSGLIWMFIEGFLLMGVFVTFYNYLTYRLMAQPYQLSQAQVGLIFSVYGVGLFSSPIMGHIAGNIGRRKVLWIVLFMMLTGIIMSISTNLWIIVAGAVLLTFGFFGGHSIASSWIGFRAHGLNTQATSLYLFCYYLGAAVIGSSSGYLYTVFGWYGVAAWLSVLSLTGLAIAWKLHRLQPLPVDMTS